VCRGDDADHDDGRLDNAGQDDAKCQGLVEAPRHQEDRDGAADAGQRVDEVQQVGAGGGVAAVLVLRSRGWDQ
jgi:hypothetical protein